jgi:hypothetical protein
MHLVRLLGQILVSEEWPGPAVKKYVTLTTHVGDLVAEPNPKPAKKSS